MRITRLPPAGYQDVLHTLHIIVIIIIINIIVIIIMNIVIIIQDLYSNTAAGKLHGL